MIEDNEKKASEETDRLSEKQTLRSAISEIKNEVTIRCKTEQLK